MVPAARDEARRDGVGPICSWESGLTLLMKNGFGRGEENISEETAVGLEERSQCLG